MTVAGYTKIGIIGAGSMGSEMAQLFAEAGLKVALFDINADNVSATLSYARKNLSIEGMVEGFTDYGKFLAAMPSPSHRLFLLSITHGAPADDVLEHLRPHLAKGDIILDGGNEWYENTERRIRELKREQRVDYIGVGVSGGYQSARRGPSFSPGGDMDALNRVLPLLERVAAKDGKGNPCVAPIGPGGSGHYVKMIHNGIEQGMLGALTEAWGILHHALGLSLDEIAGIFKRWNEEGELKNTFLVNIASDICAKRDSSFVKEGSQATNGQETNTDNHVLPLVVDKVVQDADETEGTGTWSVAEAARVHIAAPTIASAHFMRLASADRAARLQVSQQLQFPEATRADLNAEEKAKLIEDVRQAVLATFLASYTQGLQIIARKSEKEGWGVKLGTCMRVWRAGCIIASGGLGGVLEELANAFDSSKDTSKHPSSLIPAQILTRTLPALRRVVLFAVERDALVPTMGASLEWAKYVGNHEMPTRFMEAQLDWFGKHRFERWGDEGVKEGGGEVKKGKWHYEWKAA